MLAYRWSLGRVTCDNFSHFPQAGGGGAEKLSRFRKSYVKRTISTFLPANLQWSGGLFSVSCVAGNVNRSRLPFRPDRPFFYLGRALDRSRILSDYVVRHGGLKLLAFRFNLPKL